MARKNEHEEVGFKWWVRHTMIPIILGLIGSGGVASYYAFRDNSPKSVSTTIAAPPKEDVTFYLSSKANAHELREATIDIGDQILIHWNIQNSRGGKFFLTETELDGHVRLSKEVLANGVEMYDDAFTTVDCTLERDEGPTLGRSVLGSLRIRRAR